MEAKESARSKLSASKVSPKDATVVVNRGQLLHPGMQVQKVDAKAQGGEL